MPVAEPPIRYMSTRGARVQGIWQAPAYRLDVVALQPLAELYRGVMAARRAAYRRGWLKAERIAVPVISVGNLVVGGSGKTPFTRWLVGHLREAGRRPAILHGGYGADEPALHRRWHPDLVVVEGHDRVAGAQAAMQHGANVVVLDDALQHLRIARDLDIVLISADTWQEPHRLLPAGSWREPLSAIAESAVVVVTRKAATPAAAAAAAEQLRAHSRASIVATCELAIQVQHTGPSVAVCAIADARGFARQLAQSGVVVEEVLAFDDHHEYTLRDWSRVEQMAAGRDIITTEKDAVKLEKLTARPLIVATQTVRFESGAAQVERAISSVLR